jgi:transcriptional regulator
VPTWNYLIAQARGPAKVTHDAAWLSAQIAALTAAQEGRRAQPWKVSDAPEDFIAMQVRAIVGIEIEIADLRAKWKASQNRNDADRAGVVEGLEADADPQALAMAGVVRGE